MRAISPGVGSDRAGERLMADGAEGYILGGLEEMREIFAMAALACVLGLGCASRQGSGGGSVETEAQSRQGMGTNEADLTSGPPFDSPDNTGQVQRNHQPQPNRGGVDR